MFDRPSPKSGLNRADTAAVFGSALALRAQRADLVQFGTGSAVVPFGAAEPVLKVVGRFGSMGGTSTAAAVAAHFRRGTHARVVIVTDEQAMGSASPASVVPGDVPLYTWNLAGYRYGHGPSGAWNRHALGGLTDRAFALIPMIEAGQAARWDDLFDAA
jgi:hypothetical protein